MASHKFTVEDPSLESQWRSLILFGKNSATYKFSFGLSLLESLSSGSTRVSLKALAEPYARHLMAHLRQNDKQGTSPSSKFLSALRDHIRGKIPWEQALDVTVKLGFENVVDAFQNVNKKRIPKPYYEKDFGRGKKDLVFRDELFALKDSSDFTSLHLETEARWRLVETAWNLEIHPAMLQIAYDKDQTELFLKNSHLRRRNLTSARDSLNGYQKGKCFYSRRQISLQSKSHHFAEVDHFLPHANKAAHAAAGANLDGIWNLVLAHASENVAKGAKVPELRFLSRLHARNEFYIDSKHPLGETIVNQTGQTAKQRAAFLQKHYNIALTASIHQWAPKIELDKTKLYL